MVDQMQVAEAKLETAVAECCRVHDTSVCVHRDLQRALADHNQARKNASDSGLLVVTAVDAVLEDELKEKPSLRDTQALRVLGAESNRKQADEAAYRD